MISKILLNAREYEEKEGKKMAVDDRPSIHLSSRTGWMNDPNGFSYYNGMYHMFYQYYPYNTNWGLMHWGHAVSADMLHWEYLPAAMAPDCEYDKLGCFSGSAVELEDGRHLIMYTGVSKLNPQSSSSTELQTQCLAVGDGINYEKYACNPVLTEKNLPEGASKTDFRDPKMWKAKDGSYRCVIGNRPADGSGQILLYRSEDGFHWDFKQILVQNVNRYGKMWECPDFFELDGKWVLLTSPQDMLPQDLEYAAGNGTLCLIGGMNNADEFIEEQDQAIDYGIDFYAPQTISTPDGRRVMIGWMQNWDTCSVRMENARWYGQMSLPRELSIQNGRLIQKPLKELEQLHRNTVEYKNILVSGSKCLDDIRGRQLDMEIEIEAENTDEPYHKFTIYFAEKEKFHSEISYWPGESVVAINRTYSDIRRASVHQRGCKVKAADGKLKLRLILDRYSAEVFINDGEQVMTMVIYTGQHADGIRFAADGKVKMNVTKSDL